MYHLQLVKKLFTVQDLTFLHQLKQDLRDKLKISP